MHVLSFFIALVIFLGVLKILSLPIKIIFKLFINSLAAGLVLAVLSYFGIIIVLNTGIILLSAILGIPGLIIGIIITMLV